MASRVGVWAAALVALLGACKGASKTNGTSERTRDAASTSAGVLGPAPSASAKQGRRRLIGEDRAMGTEVTIQVFAPDDAMLPRPAQTLIEAALAEIHRLEKQMSTWIPESEISEVNAHAAERPVHVGPDTLAVLVKSQWASELSGGAFDITFEVMHGVWRFDHDRDGVVPEPAAVAQRRAKIDYRNVVLDRAKSEVRFKSPDTKINLGGIAKGYAIDRMVAILLAGGLEDFSVQAGGDLYAHGHKPDGSPWIVGVRDPRGPAGSFFGSLAVENHAFSTAGDYERTFTKDGKRYHHILDPRTGYPATAARSVTIWANDALTADAIDDGIFILGPERGIPLCEAIEGCGAIVVDAKNEVWVSKRLVPLFQKNRPPTDGL